MKILTNFQDIWLKMYQSAFGHKVTARNDQKWDKHRISYSAFLYNLLRFSVK